MISRLLPGIVITKIRNTEASFHNGVWVLCDVFDLTRRSDKERILYGSEENIGGETLSYDRDN